MCDSSTATRARYNAAAEQKVKETLKSDESVEFGGLCGRQSLAFAEPHGLYELYAMHQFERDSFRKSNNTTINYHPPHLPSPPKHLPSL